MWSTLMVCLSPTFLDVYQSWKEAEEDEVLRKNREGWGAPCVGGESQDFPR